MAKQRRITRTVYISADAEAAGPIPGPYSMVSFGAAVAGRHDEDGFRREQEDLGFYRELRPISERYQPEALAVSGLDRAALLRDGADPAVAMREFCDWVETVRTG